MSLVMLMGCSSFDEHEVKKKTLQREIELLQLEKRKALLQRQLEYIENSEFTPPSPH